LDNWATPFVKILSPALFLGPIEVNYLFQMAVFYLMGLAMNRNRLREILSNPITIFAAVTFLIVSPTVGDLIDPSWPYPYTVCNTVWNALGALSMVACCVPLADATSAPMKALACIIATCGCRTIYGYYLHMLVRMTLPTIWRKICLVGVEVHGDDIVFLYGTDVIFRTILLSALCSPLAERCFSWCVSPQWIFDSAHAISKRISTDKSCDSKSCDSLDSGPGATKLLEKVCSPVDSSTSTGTP
jgi:hypothetical protein